MKRWLLIGLLIFVSNCLISNSTSALSLKVQPLEYRDSLKSGEIKQGYVDISNPTGQLLQLSTSVEAFRQVDDRGSLEFYANQQIEEGLIPELDEFTLGPREQLRLYFTVDGTKLPTGDVFGALFVSTTTSGTLGVGQSVRLGTLFMLTNQTPGSRQAEISHLSVPFLQLGSGLRGQYVITNTAPRSSASGFFPEVSVSLDPFSRSEISLPGLVQSGVSRRVDFNVPDQRFGIYKISVQYGDSLKNQWVFMATGVWKWVLGALLIVVILATLLIIRYLHKKKRPVTFRS